MKINIYEIYYFNIKGTISSKNNEIEYCSYNKDLKTLPIKKLKYNKDNFVVLNFAFN